VTLSETPKRSDFGSAAACSILIQHACIQTHSAQALREALAGDKGFGIETSRIHSIAAEIKDVNDLGVEIALVVGGGNFFRGVAEQARDMDRVSADHMGMLATVINSLALQDALENRMFTRG